MNTSLVSPSRSQICQRDPHWVNHRIGGSDLTVGAQGCALSCVSMISFEFGGFQDPAMIASHTFLFTPDGLINWDRIQKFVPCIKFIWRQYGYSPETIAKYVMPGLKASELQVPINPSKNSYHWLKLVGIVKLKSGIDYLCVNPWTGKQCYAIATYGKITGSAHFVKV